MTIEVFNLNSIICQSMIYAEVVSNLWGRQMEAIQAKDFPTYQIYQSNSITFKAI